MIRVSGRHVKPRGTVTDLSQKNFFEHFSGNKLERVLGWTPALSLEDGLRDTLRWFGEHGIAWTGGGRHG